MAESTLYDKEGTRPSLSEAPFGDPFGGSD